MGDEANIGNVTPKFVGNQADNNVKFTGETKLRDNSSLSLNRAQRTLFVMLDDLNYGTACNDELLRSMCELRGW